MSNVPHEAERPAEHISYTGHEVVDDQHHKVGTVSDVLHDDRGAPRWAVVHTGVMHADKLVPVEGSYVAENGELVIPYSKEQVKHAPKAPHDHVLDRTTEESLQQHYEISSN